VLAHPCFTSRLQLLLASESHSQVRQLQVVLTLTNVLLHVAVLVQIGDVDCDHCECARAEKDDYTPRPVIVVSPEKPGADMLSVASAAFSSAHAVLKTMPEQGELAKKCLNHAMQLYDHAKANPGIYSDSEPILAKTYKNDQWEQFAYLASAWLYESTGNEAYLQVPAYYSWQCHECST
jgi:Glycosyl hydrolase family 9